MALGTALGRTRLSSEIGIVIYTIQTFYGSRARGIKCKKPVICQFLIHGYRETHILHSQSNDELSIYLYSNLISARCTDGLGRRYGTIATYDERE